MGRKREQGRSHDGRLTGSGKERPLKTLERVLSKAGIGSRVDARGWIQAGRVKVNGRASRDPDHWVDMQSDRVSVDGKPLEARERIYVLLNKPAGYLTTYKDPQGRPTVYDLITDVGTFVSPVGRLDLDTSGLLLMTNDTQFAERVTNPSSHIPKAYVVTASTRLTTAQLQQLRKGIELSDGPTRPAKVTRLPDANGHARFEITLTEGRNRQVRRMVEALGAKVVTLARVKIGPIANDIPPPGKWRALTSAEVAAINGGRECFHCKQWILPGDAHDCWTTTEAALTRDLSEDLRDAWERLRETASEFGEQRIYASHSSIIFSRTACYFFVRPKRHFLEVCVFLGRTVRAPQIKRADQTSKSKVAHLLQIRHRDEVEAPITDWLREAYDLQSVIVSRVSRGLRSAKGKRRSE